QLGHEGARHRICREGRPCECRFPRHNQDADARGGDPRFPGRVASHEAYGRRTRYRRGRPLPRIRRLRDGRDPPRRRRPERRPLREGSMPMVTIQVTREGSGPGRNAVMADEKAKLIAGVSQLLLDVLNKPLEATFVVIEEVDTENWGWGGLPVLEYRKRRAAG